MNRVVLIAVIAVIGAIWFAAMLDACTPRAAGSYWGPSWVVPFSGSGWSRGGWDRGTVSNPSPSSSSSRSSGGSIRGGGIKGGSGGK